MPTFQLSFYVKDSDVMRYFERKDKIKEKLKVIFKEEMSPDEQD